MSASGTKHFVHIRNFQYHPDVIEAEEHDVISITNDTEFGAVHMVCAPDVACSLPLRKGDRWEFRVPVTAASLYDPLFSFMRLRVVVAAPVKPKLVAPAERDKYADSFVYAAANVKSLYARHRQLRNKQLA